MALHYGTAGRALDKWVELYNGLNEALKAAGDLVNYSTFIDKELQELRAESKEMEQPTGPLWYKSQFPLTYQPSVVFLEVYLFCDLWRLLSTMTVGSPSAHLDLLNGIIRLLITVSEFVVLVA